MVKFQNLSVVQKAMIMVYKHGGSLPFLEKHVQLLHKDQSKLEVQQKYMELQKELIGDENQRRKYWIQRLNLTINKA